MTQPQTRWARIAWRKNDTPYASTYGDGYFGEADPAAEARHVFCKGLALPEAWETFFDDKKIFRIVELGFGTGLNFLQTALLWQKWLKTEWQNKGQMKDKVENKCVSMPLLDYWGIEAHPLRLQDLQRFYRCYEGYRVERFDSARLDNASLGTENLGTENLGAESLGAESLGAESLLRAWKGLATSTCQRFCHLSSVRWQLAPSLSLTLLLQDVECALAALPREVDGWYCDGFAPRANPAMWSEKVFAALARCTRARTLFPQLASFSVAKSVRTTADKYGFRTRKRKGWLAKREVLQGFFEGRKQHLPSPLPSPLPWA